MQKTLSYGFTLLELMVVVTIAAILLIWGVASFRGVIANNYSLKLSSEFNRAVNYARSEAVKRSTPVSMCVANSGLTACGGGGWSNGWLIFSDVSGDGSYNSASDTLLETYQPDSGQEIVTAPSSVITFNSMGAITTGSGAYRVSATGCTGSNAYITTISAAGLITSQVTTCP